jgi:hypothetical protein
MTRCLTNSIQSKIGAEIPERPARHAVNPSLGARRRRPVGDGLTNLSAIPAVPYSSVKPQIKKLSQITFLKSNTIRLAQKELSKQFLKPSRQATAMDAVVRHPGGRATQEQLPRRREGATWVKQAFAKHALRAAERPAAMLLGRPRRVFMRFQKLLGQLLSPP